MIMRKIKIAVDIDGTLKNLNGSLNIDLVKLLEILSSMFKNIELYIWSGGGYSYAKDFMRENKLEHLFQDRCFSKMDRKNICPDICIDDIEDVCLADINMIIKSL